MHLEEFERQSEILETMPVPKEFRLNGRVYILSNESMPGIYKVGMTTVSPEARAKELSAPTGVPTPFKVEASYHCDDPSYSEKEIHDYLSEYRVNNSREFFKHSLEDIKWICSECCQLDSDENIEYWAPYYTVISAEKLPTLNVMELLDDIGLSCVGDRLAIAERLIRIGAEEVQKKVSGKSVSYVFHSNKLTLVEDPTEREIRLTREHLESLGIYGPRMPFAVWAERNSQEVF
ncbi:GIY-YIG nuclease family protein [uncultured Cedecea sp.]|uniref:GIY-YIG nuclease family protein n=1 Tax=uncultured Cedecea sp. TaxID=988762 RepID=UPI002607ADEC|nr:GIY-YIG nuclease family protein [uncultured Cedecea sp.]